MTETERREIKTILWSKQRFLSEASKSYPAPALKRQIGDIIYFFLLILPNTDGIASG